MKRTFLHLLFVVAFVLQGSPALLAQDDPNAVDAQNNRVFLPTVINQGNTRQAADDDGADPLAPVEGDSSSLLTAESVDKALVGAAGRGVEDLRPLSLIVVLEESASPDPVAALPNVQIVHRYKNVFNGVSLITTSANMEAIANAEGVAAVYLDEMEQLNTDASTGWIGAPTVWNALGGQGSAGEGVIVGVLDSGIWPEHPSLSDPDPLGKAYDAPPGGPFACEFGSSIPGDEPFTCNNKLIGAYKFLDTYKAVIGLLPNEFDSARDDNGHGTHTATTAAGNAGVAASIFGISRGIISGVAPRAHVIAYRVCADQGCFQSDSVAAIDQAIEDGVHAINFSISGGNAPFSDAVELAFLEAYDNGIFVAASAGNSGPGLDTVSHRGPWVTTVAASSSNRYSLSTIDLRASNGDRLRLTGVSVTEGISSPLPVIVSSNPTCALPPGSFTGHIVICDRIGARLQVGFNAFTAGAAGMILRNVAATQLDVMTDNHFLPAVHLTLEDSTKLGRWMQRHTGVTGTFTQGAAGPTLGDRVTGFSSRGGPGQTLGVSKPDVTAPGIQILAGTTPMGATPLSGRPGELFQAIAGTSMSSPHVAGAGALLKALHPDWTPGQIKSALMLTAKTTNVVKEDGVTKAGSFDVGSGRIDLNWAGMPALTMDETAENYLALQSQLWNANYPSIYHPNMPGVVTVRRVVKDVRGAGGAAGVWSLSTRTDKNDWGITVPATIQVPANGEAEFKITISAPLVPLGQVRSGEIRLTNGGYELHIPVTFVRGQTPVVVSNSCKPIAVAVGGVTNCSVTMQNTSFTDANVNLSVQPTAGLPLVPGSIKKGFLGDNGAVRFVGVLAAAQPPQVTAAVTAAASPAGYLPLSIFGINPISGVGDETIVNFNVPPYVYAGEVYNRVGIVSNGYIVVGGGTGGDVDFVNSNLPDAERPNNILAPFWTDLNPGAGGALRVGVLTDGVNSWLVMDWEDVPNYTDGEVNSFQIWIGINGVEDISFTYGEAITDGDGGFLTVGAENRFGNSGAAVYFNGTGAAPASSSSGYEVGVTSIPGEPGASHTVTFQLQGAQLGQWKTCAELTSDIFEGTAVACAKNKVR